jgi:hypothetical protein
MFAIGLIGALLLSQSQLFQLFLHAVEPYSPLAAFIAGMLFASTFTVAAGGLIIIHLAQIGVHPLILILFGGLGAVSCDILIFYFVKDDIAKEISPIYDEIISKSHLKKIMHTRYFSWTLPVIGAFIIASPLPDELAVSLLGLSEMKTAEFFAISFASHLVGMSSLVISSKLL